MAQQNTYRVTAFDANGARIYSESTTRMAQARKTAREFLRYSNVRTVDLINESATTVRGYVVERYVRLSPNSGIVISNGESRNIRF